MACAGGHSSSSSKRNLTSPTSSRCVNNSGICNTDLSVSDPGFFQYAPSVHGAAPARPQGAKLESFAVGAISGLVASAVFFGVLACLRPRLKISPIIAKTRTDHDDPEYRYRIKVINKSWRACVDVHVSAATVRKRKIPKVGGEDHGPVFVARSIDVQRSRSSVIPGYRWRSTEAHYAQRIRFTESAVALLSDHDQTYEILVRITARDALSGFPRTFERRYALASAVKEGTFCWGRSLEIAPWPGEGVGQT